MGFLEIVILLIGSYNSKNRPIIKTLSVLDNLGIDARIWHVFEQSNFNVKAIIDEIVRIALVHTKTRREILLDILNSVFMNIKINVVVNGTDELFGVRNVTNNCFCPIFPL